MLIYHLFCNVNNFLKLAYSMTINKAQGQTFDKLGIHLPAPVFSHGQLYVSFLRAKSFKDIYVNICETTMDTRQKKQEKNVMYVSCGVVKYVLY